MSIISNENRQGSPFPTPEPKPELPILPDARVCGDWSAVPFRYTNSAEWAWDIRYKERTYGTMHSETRPADLRGLLSMVSFAFDQGGKEARDEIRVALGVRP